MTFQIIRTVGVAKPAMSALPKEVAVFPSDGYALAQPRGPVSGSMVVEYGRAMVFTEEWRPGFSEVWDLTFSGAVDLVPSDISAFTSLEDETLEQLAGSRTIVISPRSSIMFSVSFYARLMRKRGREVIGVRTQAEAAVLLGIDSIPVLT